MGKHAKNETAKDSGHKAKHAAKELPGKHSIKRRTDAGKLLGMDREHRSK